jgi:hypothetical protein
VAALEDEILLSIYGAGDAEPHRLAAAVTDLSKEWTGALQAVYRLKFKKPDYVTVALYSENKPWLFELALAYWSALTASDAQVDMFQFMTISQEQAAGKIRDGSPEAKDIHKLLDRLTLWQRVNKPAEFLRQDTGSPIGIVLGITEPLAFPRYSAENGLHIRTGQKLEHKCLIRTSDQKLDSYTPPVEIERRGAIGNQTRCRLYNFEQSEMEDLTQKKTFPLLRNQVAEAMREAITLRLFNNARAILEP